MIVLQMETEGRMNFYDLMDEIERFVVVNTADSLTDDPGADADGQSYREIQNLMDNITDEIWRRHGKITEEVKERIR